MSDSLNLNFGSGIYVNQIDILDTREIDLWTSPADRIIEIFINEINNDHYVFVDLYWHNQFPGEANEPRTQSRPLAMT